MTDVLQRLGSALADRYRIERELGRGGMAVVYLAHDLRHDRRVALKVLRPELALAIGPDRFLREIQIAAGLSHPNILALYDSGEVEGVLYYVMPFIEGESLRDYLERERQLPVEEAARLVQEIAGGLARAHQSGVIHRDIKPENILLSGGHAVIADFGIARALVASGAERLTETGMAIGTPEYMSPEQASGERDVDQRTDIYALGCILYEMLAGEPPYGGNNAAAITVKKLSAPLPSVRLLRDTVPEALERVIGKALARSPADRYRTAELFAAELAKASSEKAVPRGPPRPTLASRRAWLALLVGVLLLLAVGWGVIRLLRSPATRIGAVAVLPMENLMHDAAQDYFVEGMQEALIASLSRIPALRVISRTSVMGYKGSVRSVPVIARELGVDGVFEGSVLRSGNRVRITVRLVGARPERELWSRTYDRDMSDVLALHSEVAQAVARQLELTLSPAAAQRLASQAHRINPEAHEAYLKGRYHWQRQTQAEVEQAIGFFEQALQVDSGYAPAYAGLADSYIFLSWVGSDPLAAAEAYPRAKSAALRALQLDSTLSEAHTSLGIIHWRYDWNWSEAEREFRTALDLNPSEATAQHWYGLFLASRGRRDEAMAAMHRAAALDPLSLLVSVNTGWVLYFARQYPDAVRQETATLRLWPSFGPVHYHLGLAYEQLGRLPQAIQELEQARTLSGDLPYLLGALGHAYAAAGRREDALQMLRALEQRKDFAPSLAALIYTGLGDKAQALEWLRKAVEQRDAYLAFLEVNPVWDPLRGDPGFAVVLGQIRHL